VITEASDGSNAGHVEPLLSLPTMRADLGVRDDPVVESMRIIRQTMGSA